MKIIKQTVEYRYEPKQTTCPTCKTELEYENTDVKFNWNKAEIAMETTITCPVCYGKIEVDIIQPTVAPIDQTEACFFKVGDKVRVISEVYTHGRVLSERICYTVSGVVLLDGQQSLSLSAVPDRIFPSYIFELAK